MSLPGGFRSRADDDLRATAVRETREEVGIDLARETTLLGCLPDVSPALADVVVRPFVFALERRPAIVTSQEVDGVAWADVGAIARNDFPATYEAQVGESRRSFPGFRVLEHVVWGMTYRVLMDLIAAAARAGSRVELER
jgi:8-oxo-dGTP pyrophosphatase MutT (NUDIX family)